LRIESGPADTVNSSFYQDMLLLGLFKNEHIAVCSVLAGSLAHW